MVRRIVSSDDTCSGQPRIDGTRLTCGNVVFILTLGEMTSNAFLDLYPHVAWSDVEICVRYCAARQCVSEQVINYCQGCVLDERKEEPPESEEAPVNGWELAETLLGRGLRRSDL